MESLHTFTNNASPLATLQVPASESHKNNINIKHANKWTFLVANHIKFSEKQANCISLMRPKPHYLSLWLEKIVTGGQCSNLFVEQLLLDETSFQQLRQLCLDYKVVLVSLMPSTHQKSNVVKGPW